jgi:hypothetical protein
MNKVAVVVTGLAAVAAAALLLRRSDEVAPAPATPAAPAAAPAPAVPEVAPVQAPATSSPGGTAAENPDWLAYPDGTAFPPLNGVAKAPKLSWHRMIPFSKVLRVERDASGRDWYVHENGARSTTYLDGSGKAVADLTMAAPAAATVDEGSPPKNR